MATSRASPSGSSFFWKTSVAAGPDLRPAILDAFDLAAANAAPLRSAAPEHRRVDEMIGEHVDRDRNRVAVRMGDRTLSYGELWIRSGDVATRIREAGITARKA